jgi:hypothetical protein
MTERIGIKKNQNKEVLHAKLQRRVRREAEEKRRQRALSRNGVGENLGFSAGKGKENGQFISQSFLWAWSRDDVAASLAIRLVKVPGISIGRGRVDVLLVCSVFDVLVLLLLDRPGVIVVDRAGNRTGSRRVEVVVGKTASGSVEFLPLVEPSS